MTSGSYELWQVSSLGNEVFPIKLIKKGTYSEVVEKWNEFSKNSKTPCNVYYKGQVLVIKK